MTAHELQQRGYSLYYFPKNGDAKTHQVLLESGGVEYDFQYLEEIVGPTTLYILAAKRTSPTLKTQLGARQIKENYEEQVTK